MTSTVLGVDTFALPRAARRLRRALRRAWIAVFLVGLCGAAAGPLGAEQQCVVVEDFSKADVGEFPSEWKGRKESAKSVYTVAEEGKRRFLHADARDAGVQAGKKFEWDLAAYPVLAWAWRPQEFPKGADERTGKNDSALAVYAVFAHTPMSVKSMKYIWSERVAKDTHIPQSQGNTQGLVVRSGGRVGAWAEERVNVLEHYKRYFKGDEVPKPEGIAVLTDSDDTSSRARGDYAMFRVCRG